MMEKYSIVTSARYKIIQKKMCRYNRDISVAKSTSQFAMSEGGCAKRALNGKAKSAASFVKFHVLHK